MRIRSLAAMAAAVFMFSLTTAAPSEAFGWRHHGPAGWDRAQTVRHWIYYPRYHHIYRRHSATDPYGYRWVKPGYYPHYNSGYWRSAREMRKRRRHYPHVPYSQAWGYPKKGVKVYRYRRYHRHW